MLTQEQMAMRKHGIGASEIGAIVGLNPWRNSMDVFLEKTGRSEPFQGNGRTRRGALLEPHIRDWWAEQRGVTDVHVIGTVFHPQHEWIFATPDAFGKLDGQPILCETKSVGWRLRHHWPEGDLPPYVQCQVVWQQLVTSIHLADVAAWIDDEDRIVPVRWSQEVADDLVEIAREFWHDNVLADKPPAVDASESWARYLLSRFPKDAAPIIEAPDDADRWLAQLKEAKAEIADAESRKAEAENALKNLIGDHAGIERRGLWRVTWKSDSCGRVSWKDVATSLGPTDELIAKHTSAPSRRFLVKEF